MTSIPTGARLFATAFGRGATSIAANQWSALPVNVDQAKWRVWDWSQPPFFRGLR